MLAAFFVFSGFSLLEAADVVGLKSSGPVSVCPSDFKPVESMSV